MTMNSDYALSIPRAAEIAGVSERTMWRLVQDGTVKSIRASARRRIIMMSELSRHLSEGVSTLSPAGRPTYRSNDGDTTRAQRAN